MHLTPAEKERLANLLQELEEEVSAEGTDREVGLQLIPPRPHL